jgi:tetratricopeptide (TPR) repeat protein
LNYTLKKGLGSYLDPKGQSDLTPIDEEKARAELLSELVKLAAQDLVELTGPNFTENFLAPGDDPRSRKARSFVTQGEWNQAATIWEELLTLNPEYDTALFNLGIYHEGRGELEAALEYFRKAFRSNQNFRNRWAVSRVTDVLRHQGNLPKSSGGPGF